MSNGPQQPNSNDSPTNPPASYGGVSGGDNYGERLARLETHMEHLATKDDVTKMKVWVLSGVLVAAVMAVSITFAIVKFFAS